MTSMMKNCDEQPSGLIGFGSIVDTENMDQYHPEDTSIEDFTKHGTDSYSNLKKGETASAPRRDAKLKMLSIQTDVALPTSTVRAGGITSLRPSDVLSQHLNTGLGVASSKQAAHGAENRRMTAMSPRNVALDQRKAATIQRSVVDKSNANNQHHVKSSR